MEKNLYKKKIILATLAMLLFLTTIVSATFDPISAVSNQFPMITTSASTNISGRISANTTWTLAESPYVIEDDVIVETDVLLTIEPGVVVKFTAETNLIIDGALIAGGNAAHPITFTSNATTPQAGDWGTIKFRDISIDEACIIDWATIEYASAGITIYKSSPKIDNSIMQYNIDGFYSESEGVARISDSIFLNNTYGIRGSFAYYDYYPPYTRSEISNSRISNNTYGVYSYGGYLMIKESTISNNTYGIRASGTLRILGCDISYNTHGIVASSATITKSVISKNNGVGVSPSWYRYDNTTYYDSGTFSVTYSTITENKENGIVSKGSSTIHFSNLYNNTPYDAYNVAPFSWSYGDVYATNNWWGSANTTEIDEKIYDYYDDYDLKRVYYQPFLDSEVTIPSITHDLAITDVTASPTSVSAGYSVDITVSVVNEGDFAENVTVIALYDSVQIGNWTYDMYGLLQPGASTTASFYWYTWGIPSGVYTISAEVSVVPGETDTEDNFFTDGQVEVIGPPPQPPYASFTYNPYYPSVDEPVTFDASSSYDPDGGQIVSYAWNYGDNTTGSGVITTHIYNASGTYAVILKVTDDDGQNATSTQYVSVSPPMLVHDIAIVDVEPYPTRVIPGDSVTINVTVENQGDFTETFAVTVFYDSNNAAPPQTVTDLPPKTSIALTFTWNTTGVAVGEYLIKAQAEVVPGEGDIGDNTLIDDIVVVAHRILAIEPSGDFDYAIYERVRIKIAALVRDTVTMEPVSNANVSVQIYDDTGNLWVSSLMTENPSGSGIYIWTSNDTIVRMRIAKGIYLARVGASFRDSPTAYSMLLFHIDPPAEGANQTLYYATLVTVIALASVAVISIRKRWIASKIRRLNR